MVTYPFSAVVGQDDLKLSLLLACIDPAIGGVLAFGDRGTGKSTTIRALAALLPEVIVTDNSIVDPDQDNSVTKPAPVVDLPLGATDDRIVGSLDLEAALVRGEKKFQPGLLAAAHQGFLYIDEVNLLEDHLVDLLLDVCASGENVIEREGLSLRHPARFVLVGSGNPEEGELRPQLLDRFGLAVDVRTPTEITERLEIIRRREGFDKNPTEFLLEWRPRDQDIKEKIEAGRRLHPSIEVSDDILEKMAGICIALGTDGLRGELSLSRAARALAAFDGNQLVTEDHLRRVAIPSLRHRLRKNPLDDADASIRVERAMADVLG